MGMNDCVFCKIAAGEIPAKIVYQDEITTAFKDLNPVAPVHVLIIPNRHIPSVNQTSAEDEGILGHLVSVAKQLAAEFEVDQSGYRLVINSGPDAGQSVFHVHMHLIGGRKMPFRFE